MGLATLLAVMTPEGAESQRLTGTLTGRVVDLAGEAMMGAVVTINSPALITPDLSTETNERGDFRFASLEPGIYEVKAELPGVGAVIQENVRINLGATTKLAMELLPQFGEVLFVTATPPTVDTVATKIGVNYSDEMLHNIPHSRNITEVFNFTPAVTGSSARGSTVRGNAFQYDAVDVTDPTVGTQFVSFNYDTIEEIQIETGGHPAEYGQMSGGLINIVTKSGGNDVSGEANFYFQNSDLTSTNGESITSRFPDLQSGELLKRIDTQGQLGGPIVRNRVWAFGAFRYLNTDTTVVGFNDSSGEPVPTNANQKFAFGKITAQLNPDHRIVAGVHWDSLARDNRGAGAFTPPESTRSQDGASLVPNVEWTGIFADNTFAQVRFTAVDNNFDLVPKNDEPACINLDTGVVGCSDGRLDRNDRNRKQFMAAFSYFRRKAGTHDLKFGFEYEDSDDLRDFSVNQDLVFYNVNDAVGNEVPYTATTYQTTPTQEAIDRISFYAQDSWSVQDRLTFNLGLRVDNNEGWFPEQQLASGGTQPEIRNVVSQTDVSPRVGVAIAVGELGQGVIRASYSRYVDALITQNFSFVNGNAISGQVRADCSGPLSFLCGPGDGDFSSVTLREFGASNTTMDENLRLPKTDDIVAGFEWAVRPTMSLAVYYTKKEEFDLIEDVESARDFIPRTAHDPGDSEVDRNGDVVDVADPQSFTVFDADLDTPSEFFITNPDLAKRDYQDIQIILNRRMADRWQLLSSFVVSESTGLVGTSFADSSSISGLFDDPNSFINAEGKLGLNRTYQLKLLGTYQAPYDFVVSGYYRWLSGRPYNRTVRFTEYDSNGDGANDTPFDGGSILIDAETRGSRDLDSLHIVDLRVEKQFVSSYGRLGLVFDVFNLFNSDTVTSKRTRTSLAGNFGEPLGFLGPRKIRIGARFTFP